MNTQYAGFLLRFVAIIIDVIVVGILQTFIVIPIFVALGFGFASTMSAADMQDPANNVGMIGGIIALVGTYILVASILQILYFTFMESSKTQATLGKMALGIIVTDMNGNRLDFGKALVRNLCRILSGFFFCIGYIVAAFTEKQQALHDLIAGTLVVKKPATTQQ